MTKIYRLKASRTGLGSVGAYFLSVEDAINFRDESMEDWMARYDEIYECRLVAPRTKKTVVDAANERFDEVVLVWSPAVQ